MIRNISNLLPATILVIIGKLLDRVLIPLQTEVRISLRAQEFYNYYLLFQTILIVIFVTLLIIFLNRKSSIYYSAAYIIVSFFVLTASPLVMWMAGMRIYIFFTTYIMINCSFFNAPMEQLSWVLVLATGFFFLLKNIYEKKWK